MEDTRWSVFSSRVHFHNDRLTCFFVCFCFFCFLCVCGGGSSFLFPYKIQVLLINLTDHKSSQSCRCTLIQHRGLSFSDYTQKVHVTVHVCVFEREKDLSSGITVTGGKVKLSDPHSQTDNLLGPKNARKKMERSVHPILSCESSKSHQGDRYRQKRHVCCAPLIRKLFSSSVTHLLAQTHQ